jgi:hypothetical protein
MSKPDRADFSPSGQEITPRGNWLERKMLERISSVALRLPEKFDERGKGGSLIVRGGTIDNHTDIKLEEILSHEGDDATEFTDIRLRRAWPGSKLIVALSVDRYIADETAVLRGDNGYHETFALGSQENSLSLFSVMRTVTLATQTVEWAKTLDYLGSPDPQYNFPQMF